MHSWCIDWWRPQLGRPPPRSAAQEASSERGPSTATASPSVACRCGQPAGAALGTAPPACRPAAGCLAPVPNPSWRRWQLRAPPSRRPSMLELARGTDTQPCRPGALHAARARAPAGRAAQGLPGRPPCLSRLPRWWPSIGDDARRCPATAAPSRRRRAAHPPPPPAPSLRALRPPALQDSNARAMTDVDSISLRPLALRPGAANPFAGFRAGAGVGLKNKVGRSRARATAAASHAMLVSACRWVCGQPAGLRTCSVGHCRQNHRPMQQPARAPPPSRCRAHHACRSPAARPRRRSSRARRLRSGRRSRRERSSATAATSS